MKWDLKDAKSCSRWSFLKVKKVCSFSEFFTPNIIWREKNKDKKTAELTNLRKIRHLCLKEWPAAADFFSVIYRITFNNSRDKHYLFTFFSATIIGGRHSAPLEKKPCPPMRIFIINNFSVCTLYSWQHINESKLLHPYVMNEFLAASCSRITKLLWKTFYQDL